MVILMFYIIFYTEAKIISNIQKTVLPDVPV